MEKKRFRPLFDRTYILVLALLAFAPALLIFVLAFFEPTILFVAVPTFLFVSYFIISSAVGYVELREKSVYIRFGFFMKREIDYSAIRRIEKNRAFYSQSMAAIKNAMEHIDIYYNTFDVVSVSVIGNEALMKELRVRISQRV